MSEEIERALQREIEAHRVTLEDRASWESRAMDLEARLSVQIKDLAAMDALHNQAWQRAEKAEARLAELVSEVKAWMGDQPYATPGLYDLLAEYEGGKPRCKVCGLFRSSILHSGDDFDHSFDPEGEHG